MRGARILAGVLVALVAAFVAAQAPNGAPGDLVKAVRARDEAVDKIDVTTWQRYTTQHFTLVNQAGKMLTRLERITELQKTKPAAAASACGEEKITVFAQGMGATRRCLSDGVWYLEVWTKSPTDWQVVAVQATTASK